MNHKEPSREATLKEVLAEVSVADLGEMFKGWLSFLGCMLVFMIILFAVTLGLKGAGLSDWGVHIPNWIVFGLIGWAIVHQATSETSFHKVEWSWYFPKQGWTGSLLLTAYAGGFVYLLGLIYRMERGVESGLAFFAVWLLYTSPFTAFTAVTNLGHKKLMEKRRLEMNVAETIGSEVRT